MVLLVFVKKLYLLDKIIKSKIIAFFKYIRCVMLIEYLPTSGIQNPGQFTKIPWILPNFP